MRQRQQFLQNVSFEWYQAKIIFNKNMINEDQLVLNTQIKEISRHNIIIARR